MEIKYGCRYMTVEEASQALWKSNDAICDIRLPDAPKHLLEAFCEAAMALENALKMFEEASSEAVK